MYKCAKALPQGVISLMTEYNTRRANTTNTKQTDYLLLLYFEKNNNDNSSARDGSI